MQLRIHFDDESINPSLYKNYCEFILDKINETIAQKADPRKYKVREELILKSSLISWRGDPPKSIDLMHLVCHCLSLKRIKGEYVITLNEYRLVPKSRTKLSKLIRLLEYGNEEIPPYPLIRSILVYYQKIYPNLMPEFMLERMF